MKLKTKLYAIWNASLCECGDLKHRGDRYCSMCQFMYKHDTDESRLEEYMDIVNGGV